jgi:Holliday junction resolvase RusA-like endonuclease
VAIKKKARPLPRTWDDARVEMVPQGWFFALPDVISANRQWRAAKGRTYKSKEARYDTAQAQHRFRHVEPLSGAVAVTIRWSRTRRAGDLDNKCKGVLDLLKGIAYGDDAQVVAITMTRHDDLTVSAGLEVTVTLV